ncbi:MAG: YeeE/YedE family protein, partial [Nitrospirae bacterium]
MGEFFKDPEDLIIGFITGIVWGFVLQKAKVSKADVVINLLLLRDFTVHRVGVSLLITTMLIIHILYDLDPIQLSLPHTVIAGQLIGGIIMGIGIGISGYCPATSVAAIGEGAIDAIFFICGMLTGSAIFAEYYPFFQKTIIYKWDLGYITLPELLGISHWFLIGLFILA